MNKIFILLLILITGFTANDVQKEIITLNWKISSESGNKLGYFFENAGYIHSGSQVPLYSKSFPLENSKLDYQFVLENPVYTEIDCSNTESIIGEFPEKAEILKTRLRSGDSQKIEIQLPAAIREGDKILLLKKFDLKQIPVKLKSAQAEIFQWKTESVLKSGKWIKINTPEKGIYIIPWSRLVEWGFSNPSQVKVFGSGGMNFSEDPGNIEVDDLPQVSIWHGKNKGTDCLFFYAPGSTEWNPDVEGFFKHQLNPFGTKGHFFLSEDAGISKTIEMLPVTETQPTHSISSFIDYDHYELEQYNLIHSGRHWYGEKFINGTTRNFTFQLANPVIDSDISVYFRAAARSSNSSEMRFSSDLVNLGNVSFTRVNTSSKETYFANEKSSRVSLPVVSDNLELTLKYYGSGSNPEAWLDYIEINYQRFLKTSNKTLFFRDLESVGADNVLEFNIETDFSELKIWDVTDVFNVKEVPVQKIGNIAKGRQPATDLREYAAFGPGGDFPEPEFAGEVANQNLHALNTPEFLIVSHPNFLSYANELADFHRTYDGMQVEVVSVNNVYNEFSSGNKNATGIRNFIKMFYDRNQGLKYVLLFGDGSYDTKNINPASSNFIPTYQSENSLNPVESFLTDDYYVILDAGESVKNGAIDIGIGRIPASTSFEAASVIEKIKNYHKPEALGNWRNVVCFIGDDGDGNLHMSQSEQLANQVNKNYGEFITDKIYFDSYPKTAGPGGGSYPGVTSAINQRVKDGVLILNYVGHANPRFLGHENVLDVSQINSWSNPNNLPIFVTATCEFSRFDEDDTSAGEYILFNPNGGGIGLFSTTRIVYSYSNFILSQNFYKYVFQKDENGEHYRMGDIMRLAKTNTINTTNKRNFSLLGDPALKLSYPKHKVVTSTINGKDANGNADTLGALQHITISGYITDALGNIQDDFSGEISSTFFDKAVQMSTMGNGGETPYKFKLQENIIYKGLAEVKNGAFSFSFVIPKDISYNLGQGKIMYYANNGEEDAHGSFENFLIGGTGSEISDNEGPEIELFMDTPAFTSGGKVSKNPNLLAYISDENGVNYVGTGIGHDITAVLNHDYSNALVLNNYYQTNTGDFTSGSISYPLKDLPIGKHTLTLKAWDVANNSSEVDIEFEVTGEFVISQAINYPNPVYDHTFFVFEHNQADATFNTVFEIFDINGRRLDNFTTQVGSNGMISNPVRWDLSRLKTNLRGGIYIFRVTVQNADGLITSKSGKMIVAR